MSPFVRSNLPATALLCVGLLVLVFLSGCAGKTAGPANATGRGPIQPTDTGPVDPNCPGCSAAVGGTLDPKRHFHHYWGDATEVIIFEGLLRFKPDAASGQAALSDVTKNLDDGCRSVGYVQWDLEDDGDDVNQEQLSPVNPDTKHADTVFAGADFLRVELQSMDSTIVGIGFKYRPGNLNYFLPESGDQNGGTCGVQMVRGQPFTITVGPGQADPPHQFFASRWEFQAFSLLRPEPDGGDVPSVGQGSFKIKIVAHNGGEDSLDPAHPDLYGSVETYNLGCAEDTVANMAIADPALRPRGGLTDIRWADGRIVPLITDKVIVTLTVKYTGLVAGTTVDLWFHGSNTTKYSRLGNADANDQPKTFEIPDPAQILADPPYEYKTLWRFELHPKAPGGAAEATIFSGSFKLCAEAHRIAGSVLT